MTWHEPGPRVLMEPLHLDDVETLGALAIDYTSTEDQSAKLQSIANLAAAADGARGTVVLAGNINIAEQVVWPVTPVVPIYGYGTDRSQFTLTTDLGPGKFPLKFGKNGTDIRDFSVQGPGGPVLHDGVLPCETTAGIFLPGLAIVNNVAVRGFAAGLAITNDHQEMHRFDGRGNGYPVDLIDNPAGGLGDQYWERCFFTSANRAGMALCDTATLANARLIQGHQGSAFGIWRYPAGTMSATGDQTSAVLTKVAVPPWAPAQLVGLTVAGMNIAPGTTVLDVTGSGFNRTLTLSQPPTGICNHIYFVKHQYACTGSVAQGPTLTNVNIPDIIEMASAQFGVPIEGPNIPAGTTINAVSGTPGNYTLGISNTPTGNVVAMTFAPRGTTLSGVVYENHSFEYNGHAVMYDEGRTRGSWTNVTFHSPGEFGTGNGNKWPGKPDPGNGQLVGNFDIGAMDGFHWLDNFIGVSINPNQPFINADAISRTRIDQCPSVSTAKFMRLRTVAEGNASTTGVTDVQAGQRGAAGCGIRHNQFAQAKEAITKGALLETWSGGVRESRNNEQSLLSGFAGRDYDIGDVVQIVTQNEVTSQMVKNHASSPAIGQNATIKPDPNHQGCVIARTTIDDGINLGRVNNAAIAPGTLGQAQVRVP